MSDVQEKPDAPVLDAELYALREQMRSLESTTLLLDRLRFGGQHGLTFNGQRDDYKLYGYPDHLTYQMFRSEYDRGGISGTCIDVMPDACWRGDAANDVPAFELVEDEDPDTTTKFEQAWLDLDSRLDICGKLHRADKLALLSTYSVILLGDGAGDLAQPLRKLTTPTPDALIYFQLYSGSGGPGSNHERRGEVGGDAQATIFEYEDDPKSPRFGLPRSYTLKHANFKAGTPQPTVHWSRVLHFPAEGLLENEVFGQPGLQRIWNLLIDLRKVTSGGSEAFFLRANAGMHINVDKDLALTAPTGNGQTTEYEAVLAKLREDLEAYKHNLTRWIRTRGVDIKQLGSDVANFSNPADAVITQIAGAKRIPKRILTGSEMGELASSQDRENFKAQVIGRQLQHCTPIIKRLANHLIENGYLPKPKEYKVKWPQIQTLTENEKADGALKWSQTKIGEDPVYTDAEIRDKWYGMEPLTDEQRDEINTRKEEAVQRQQQAMGAQLQQKQQQKEEEDDEKDEELRAAMARQLKALYDPMQNRDADGRWTSGPLKMDLVGKKVASINIEGKRYSLRRRKSDYVLHDVGGKQVASAVIHDGVISSASAGHGAPKGILGPFMEMVRTRLGLEGAEGFQMHDRSPEADEHWTRVGRRIDVLIREHGVDWLSELVKQQKGRAAEGLGDVEEVLRSLTFDPNQERDAFGRWTSGGTSTVESDRVAEEVKQRALADQQTNPLAHPTMVIGGTEHPSVKRYVAAYGEEFEAQPLPQGIRQGNQGECYMNASLLVMTHPDLDFAEGYAQSADIPGLTFQHAWAVTKDGKVVDPTWKKPEGSKYFGVRYAREAYLAHIVKAKFYGVIGAGHRESLKVAESGVPKLRRAELRTSEFGTSEFRAARFDPSQARDEHGRWTDGSSGVTGSGGSGGSLGKVPRSQSEAMARFNDDVAYPPANDSGRDTQQRFKRGDGTYTPERQQLHSEIEKIMIGSATPVANPTAYVMGGGWAAGKTTTLTSGAVVLPENHVKSDGDLNKGYLPEYKAGLGKEAYISEYVHEESSDVAKHMTRVAARDGYNVVMDGTGDGTYENLERKMKVLRDGGLRIEANYVTVDTETALRRAQERGAKTGRHVPADGLRAVHRDVSKILPLAMERGLFDKATLWDTNESGKPRKVASSEGASLTVHDAALWQRFLAKARE